MLRIPHCLDNRLTNGGEDVSLTLQPASLSFSPGRLLVLTSVRDSIDPRAIVQIDGLVQLNNPMISSGIETCYLGDCSIVPQTITTACPIVQ
jgi:hypothetical protein